GLLLTLLLALLCLLGLLAATAGRAAVGEHRLGLVVVVGGHRRVGRREVLIAEALEGEGVVRAHGALLRPAGLPLGRVWHEVERRLELLGGEEELPGRVP